MHCHSGRRIACQHLESKQSILHIRTTRSVHRHLYNHGPVKTVAAVQTLQAPAESSVSCRATVRDASAAQLLLEVQAVTTQPKQPCLVVMFTAGYCGPCKLVSRELLKVDMVQDKKVKIMVVDVEKEPDLAKQLQITRLPTLLFVGKDASKPTISTEGNVSSKLILDIIDNRMHLAGGDLAQRLRLS